MNCLQSISITNGIKPELFIVFQKYRYLLLLNADDKCDVIQYIQYIGQGLAQKIVQKLRDTESHL